MAEMRQPQSISMDPADLEAARIRAASRGLTLSAYVRRLLRDDLDLPDDIRDGLLPLCRNGHGIRQMVIAALREKLGSVINPWGT